MMILIFFLMTATVFSPLPARADATDYFPLQAGNTWLYRQADGRTAGDGAYRTISVEGAETIAERDYFHVQYFGQRIWLRDDGGGSIVMLERSSGEEKPWLSLDGPEGSSFATAIDPCSSTGEIAARDAAVSTPAGPFDGALEVRFRGPCADAGITQQFYVPGVGLARHEETSIAGPRIFELVYYRVDARSGSGPELSFTMALDAARYTPGATAGVRLTLRSTNPEALALEFPSGQSYDFEIYDAGGKLVYRWSSGRAFTQLFRQEQFGPGERTYALSAPLNGLPAGRYKAQGYLTTNPVMFTSALPFEIVP